MYNLRLLFKEQITVEIESNILQLINTNEQLYFGVASNSIDSFVEYTELNIDYANSLRSSKNESIMLVGKNIEINWLPIMKSNELSTIIDNYSSSYFGILKNSVKSISEYSAKFTIFEHYMHNNDEYRMLAVSFVDNNEKNNFINKVNRFSDYIDMIIQD